MLHHDHFYYCHLLLPLLAMRLASEADELQINQEKHIKKKSTEKALDLEGENEWSTHLEHEIQQQILL